MCAQYKMCDIPYMEGYNSIRPYALANILYPLTLAKSNHISTYGYGGFITPYCPMSPYIGISLIISAFKCADIVRLWRPLCV